MSACTEIAPRNVHFSNNLGHFPRRLEISVAIPAAQNKNKRRPAISFRLVFSDGFYISGGGWGRKGPTFPVNGVKKDIKKERRLPGGGGELFRCLRNAAIERFRKSKIALIRRLIF